MPHHVGDDGSVLSPGCLPSPLVEPSRNDVLLRVLMTQHQPG